MIKISIAQQTLALFNNDSIVKKYSISTGKNGAGEENGSGKTPRGWHVVRAKIGKDAPLGTVFVGRRATGEIFAPELRAQYPERDWILTRIMWLSGLEKGKNRLGNVDTMQRFIYLHGSPDDVAMGTPGSKGCVRMRNQDIVELYDLIQPGIRVLIE